MAVIESPAAINAVLMQYARRSNVAGDGGSRRLIGERSERLFLSTISKRRWSAPSARRAHSIRATSHAASDQMRATRGRELRMPSAKELASVKLPALECSLGPSEMHPDYEQVKGHCDEWIERVAQPPTPAACRFLRDCRLPSLVCRFIPRALSGPRLLHAIKLIAWLMIADDDDDHPELLGSDYASTSHRADRIMAILTREPAPAQPRMRLSNWPLPATRCSSIDRLDAFAHLWQDIYPEMSPLLRSRFTSSMADYFEGIKMQAALRNEVCVPDVESYMEIRRQASFTIPSFILVEYASGIELDQVAVESAHVVELRNKAVDYISLCNDIFSCYKEISVGDYFNLPSILYTYGLPSGTSTRTCTSFQDAVDHVAELTQDLKACCTSLIASIKEENSKPSIDPIKARHIHAYADTIALGMCGALAWFYETPRYRQPCTQPN